MQVHLIEWKQFFLWLFNSTLIDLFNKWVTVFCEDHEDLQPRENRGSKVYLVLFKEISKWANRELGVSKWFLRFYKTKTPESSSVHLFIFTEELCNANG